MRALGVMPGGSMKRLLVSAHFSDATLVFYCCSSLTVICPPPAWAQDRHPSGPKELRTPRYRAGCHSDQTVNRNVSSSNAKYHIEY